MNPLLLQSHMTFVYLQRNIVDNNKVNSRTDMASCVPFVFAKGIIGVHCPLGFVITTEPLGFVLTKEVNVFLLRVLRFVI